MTQATRFGFVIGALIVVLGGLYATKSLWAPMPLAPVAAIATTTTEGTTPASPAPVTAEDGVVTLALGQTGVAGDLRIVPHELLEDSRCALGVECVWAGRVRLTAALAGSWGATDQIFTLGQALTSGGGEKVTLTAVVPPKVASSTTALADYRFTFTIVGP